MARFYTKAVEKFIEFLENGEAVYSDPLDPLSITITIDEAKEIVDYYRERLLVKDKEIRELKDLIISKLKEENNEE